MNRHIGRPRRWWLRVLIGVPVLVTLVGWIVASLWNWLMPALFGLPAISFWQALGLLVLTRILFGGFVRPMRLHRHGMRARWERMTPEERDAFSHGLRHGFQWKRPGDRASDTEVPTSTQSADHSPK
jgi:hypothetical protein